MMRRNESSEHTRRTNNRAPNNNCLMVESGEELQRATFRHRQDPVDLVYQPSPVGPAVSMYPRRYHEAAYERRERYVHPIRAESPSSGYDPREHSSSSQQYSYYPSKSGSFTKGDDPRHYPPSKKTSSWETKPRQHHQDYDHHPNRDHSRETSSSSYHPSRHDKRSVGGPRTISTVEISPGVRVRLRGAVETRRCILQDYFVPATCFSCDLDMFCIRDASYVLCPDCRVVNPLDLEGEKVFLNDGGLGLGFTLETLQGVKAEAAVAMRFNGEPPAKQLSTRMPAPPSH